MPSAFCTRRAACALFAVWAQDVTQWAPDTTTWWVAAKRGEPRRRVLLGRDEVVDGDLQQLFARSKRALSASRPWHRRGWPAVRSALMKPAMLSALTPTPHCTRTALGTPSPKLSARAPLSDGGFAADVTDESPSPVGTPPPIELPIRDWRFVGGSNEAFPRSRPSGRAWTDPQRPGPP